MTIGIRPARSGPARREEDPPLADMARVFRALADPTRLAIFQMVRGCCAEGCSEQEASNSISKIAGHFDVSLSTVSHHMKELRNAGLIQCYRRGQTRYCAPDAAALRLLENFLLRPSE